jgi:hypothetical protein
MPGDGDQKESRLRAKSCESLVDPAGTAGDLSPVALALARVRLRSPNRREVGGNAITFTSTKAGLYTIQGTYQPTSPQAVSSGSDAIEVEPGPPCAGCAHAPSHGEAGSTDTGSS